MVFNSCPLPGLILIEHKQWKDDRGYFMETYQIEKFQKAGIPSNFVQDNISISHRGVVRGLHAQAGAQAQGKLVRVLKGRVWDVAVDIRVGSPTFSQHFGVELSAENHRSLWIPPGFLHGFVSLEDETIFTYKVTGLYDPSGELGVFWDDPELAIGWPLKDTKTIISAKDAALPNLNDIKSPFQY